MKKLSLLLPLLFACNIERNPNLAELRIKSDVTNAKCASGKLSDGTYIAKCDLPRTDGKGTVTVVAAMGGDYPFQTWQFNTNTQIKEAQQAQADAQKKAQEEAQKQADAQKAAAAGSGSGSASKK